MQQTVSQRIIASKIAILLCREDDVQSIMKLSTVQKYRYDRLWHEVNCVSRGFSSLRWKRQTGKKRKKNPCKYARNARHRWKWDYNIYFIHSLQTWLTAFLSVLATRAFHAISCDGHVLLLSNRHCGRQMATRAPSVACLQAEPPNFGIKICMIIESSIGICHQTVCKSYTK